LAVAWGRCFIGSPSAGAQRSIELTAIRPSAMQASAAAGVRQNGRLRTFFGCLRMPTLAQNHRQILARRYRRQLSTTVVSKPVEPETVVSEGVQAKAVPRGRQTAAGPQSPKLLKMKGLRPSRAHQRRCHVCDEQRAPGPAHPHQESGVCARALHATAHPPARKSGPVPEAPATRTQQVGWRLTDIERWINERTHAALPAPADEISF
jgi:hypothetical protein